MNLQKKGNAYRLPNIYNKMSQTFNDKITTHSLDGIKPYIRRHFIDSYDEVCLIKNCYICDQNCSTETSLPNVSNLSWYIKLVCAYHSINPNFQKKNVEVLRWPSEATYNCLRGGLEILTFPMGANKFRESYYCATSINLLGILIEIFNKSNAIRDVMKI